MASFTTTSSTFKDRARQYLNDAIDELLLLADWQFRLKVSTLTTTNGTAEYDLNANVMFPINFIETTQDKALELHWPSWVDERDMDLDDTGVPSDVVLLGLTATTGCWNMRIYPIPDASTYSVRYRYWSYVPAIVENSSTMPDTTQMDYHIPRHLQQVLYLWIAARFFLSKGAQSNYKALKAEGMSIVEPAVQLNTKLLMQVKSTMGNLSRFRTNRPVDFYFTGPVTVTT